jgi:hypothetical protein
MASVQAFCEHTRIHNNSVYLQTNKQENGLIHWPLHCIGLESSLWMVFLFFFIFAESFGDIFCLTAMY